MGWGMVVKEAVASNGGDRTESEVLRMALYSLCHVSRSTCMYIWV